MTLGIDVTSLHLGFCFCNRGTFSPTLQDYCKGQTWWLSCPVCFMGWPTFLDAFFSSVAQTFIPFLPLQVPYGILANAENHHFS